MHGDCEIVQQIDVALVSSQLVLCVTGWPNTDPATHCADHFNMENISNNLSFENFNLGDDNETMF